MAAPDRIRLMACTIYRDDAEYLAEWVEFHRLVGIEHFVLYDNGSTDDHREVLAPYVQEGVATLHDWPQPFLGHQGRPRAMLTAFEHCVGAHGDARWIAFLDVDEFLFAPDGTPLPEVLRGYEGHPGVTVSRAEFGPSGHVTRPDGLVIESYLQRRPVRPDDEAPYKSIVDPRRVARCLTAHSFVYRDGMAVDENGREIDIRRRTTRKPVSWERLRVHHYWSRSEEERIRKAQRWREAGSTRRVPSAPVAGPRAGHPRLLARSQATDRAHPVTDESLLRYVPAVRQAVAQRERMRLASGSRD